MSYPSQPSALIQPERIYLTGTSATRAGAPASHRSVEQARCAIAAEAGTGRQREELASAQGAATFIHFIRTAAARPRQRARGGCTCAGP